MSVVATNQTFGIGVTLVDEPFYRYVFEWDDAETQTDTPDLLGAFEQWSERLSAADYRAMDIEIAAAHEDLAEASRRSIPPAD